MFIFSLPAQQADGRGADNLCGNCALYRVTSTVGQKNKGGAPEVFKLPHQLACRSRLAPGIAGHGIHCLALGTLSAMKSFTCRQDMGYINNECGWPCSNKALFTAWWIWILLTSVWRKSETDGVSSFLTQDSITLT